MTQLPKTLKTLFVGLAASFVLSMPASANEFQIMNGEEVDVVLASYPWYASIGYTGYDAYDSHICGASLISPNWLLTAAHCVYQYRRHPEVIEVTLGRHYLSAPGGVRIGARQIVIHPEYDDYNTTNDIALIELNRSVDYPRVKLAWPSFPAYNGQQNLAIGHGAKASLNQYLVNTFHLSLGCKTNYDTCLREMSEQGQSQLDILRNLLLANGLGDPKRGLGYYEIQLRLHQLGYWLPSFPNAELSEILGGYMFKNRSFNEIAHIIRDATDMYGTNEIRQVMMPLVNDTATCQQLTGYPGITDNMLCAGSAQHEEKTTCFGDSGGPLFTPNDYYAGWIQTGITSFGLGGCGNGVSVYTRVSRYLDWIGDIVPNINIDRTFTYGERVLTDILKPRGNEQSNNYGPGQPAWLRYYPVSNGAFAADNNRVFIYSGPEDTFYDIGDLGYWYGYAHAAGF